MIVVVLFNVAPDGGLQVDDGMEDAALKALSGQVGEEVLDGIEQEADVGVKWKSQQG